MSHNNKSRPTDADARLSEAENLIWSLLDERLEEADMRRLTGMLEEDAAVRARYLECVQLHVDLREHFGREAAEKDAKAIVLPNLLPGLPGAQGIPQVTE